MPRTEAEFRWAMMSTDDPAEKMMLLRLSRGATDVHPSGPGAIRNAITGAAGRSTQALLFADELARKKAAEAKRLAELKLAEQAKRLAIQAKRAEAYRKAQAALERKRNADAQKLEDSLNKIAKASSGRGIRRDEAAILRNLSAFLSGKGGFDPKYKSLETQTIEGIQAWPELRKLGKKSERLARNAISNAIRLKNGRAMSDRMMFMNISQLEGFAREDARAAAAAQKAAQKAAEAMSLGLRPERPSALPQTLHPQKEHHLRQMGRLPALPTFQTTMLLRKTQQLTSGTGWPRNGRG
jgi:hypothetical protein